MPYAVPGSTRTPFELAGKERSAPERRVRCPVCRAALAVELLRSIGGACPRCSAPLLGRGGPRQKPAQAPLAQGYPGERWCWGRARHLVAVASTLGRADESAKGGDYADALAWLATVEVIGEQLSDEYGSKRRAWRAALRAKTVRPADAEPLRCLRRELTSWPVDRSPVGTTPRQRVGCKEGIPIDGACSRLMPRLLCRS